MSKRIVCALLSLILLVGLVPVNALAAAEKEKGVPGVIINTEKVNVRKGPGVPAEEVTKLKKGTKVTVYETTVKDNAVWGRIDEGWVYMFYVRLDAKAAADLTNTDEKPIASGRVISRVNLNVRAGAGMQAALKTSLPTGTVINIYEKTSVNGAVWGRIDKDSWVCLTYVDLGAAPEIGSGSGNTTPETSKPGTKQAKVVDCSTGVNIRSGPGTQHHIVGKAPLNSIITYGDVTTVNGFEWVETQKGWVCSQYLRYLDDEETTTPGGAQKPEGGNTPAGAQTGVVVNNPLVNVRSGPGVDYGKVMEIASGTKVNVYETTKVGDKTWGRIDQGWIYMHYVKLDPVGSGSSNSNNSDTRGNATGTVISKINLNVRTGPGLSYKAVAFQKPGSKVTIYEQTLSEGMSWGRIDGGWVCLAYISIESSGNTGRGEMGTIARCYNAANIRSAPGTGSALLGTIAVGSRVEVLEQVNFNGAMWGHVAQGWISMEYILLDSEMPNPPAPEGGKPVQPNQPVQPEGPSTAQGVPFSIGCIVDIANGLKVRQTPSLLGDNIVSQLKNGDSAQIMELVQSEGKLWGRVAGGWIDLTFVKFNSDAIVRVQGAAVRKNHSAASDKVVSLNKDTPIIIKDIALDGKSVWGRTDEGWIDMSQAEIGGKPGKVVNKNPEVGFTGTGTIAKNNKVYVEAVNNSDYVYTFPQDTEIQFNALKDGFGTEQLWAKVEVSGRSGWVDLANVVLNIQAVVNVDEVNAYKTAGAENVVSKVLRKNEKVSIVDLDLVGSKVWGKVDGGWINLANVTIGGTPDKHVNSNPEVLFNATANNSGSLDVRVDASAKCERATVLTSGKFDILALKNDDGPQKLWGKVMVGGVIGWVDLSAKEVTFQINAIANQPTVTVYETHDTSSVPVKVIKKDDAVVITNLRLVATTVWGKSADGWMQMSEVTIDGVPEKHVNTNPEVAFYIYGIANENLVARMDASDETEALKPAINKGSTVTVQALKAGDDGVNALWGKTLVAGVPGWVKMTDLTIDVPAIVRAESLKRYTATDASKINGTYVHNNTLKVSGLALVGSTVWGSDGSGWIDMSKVAIDGKPETWPNKNAEIAFKATLATYVEVTTYDNATALSIPVGSAPAGTYTVLALKKNGEELWGKISDAHGNISWMNLTKAGVSMTATVCKKNVGLYEKPDASSKRLQEIPEGDVVKISSLILSGDKLVGKATIGTDTGWVFLSSFTY